MGSEYLMMSKGGGMGSSEHYVVKTLAGDPELVRARLAEALEEMGYRVITESPLLAKRPARGGGAYGFSSDILDYPTTLTVGLKASGRGATRATFDYAIGHPMVTKGDKHTLTREAEALIALATRRVAATECMGCGAEVIAESRFCRQCGAPRAQARLAELEVLRLTAGAQAGYQLSIIGLICLLVAILIPLILIFKAQPDPARLANFVRGVVFLSSLIGAFGFWGLIAGILRLRKTLAPPQESVEAPAQIAARPVSTRRTNELPAADGDGIARGSVVEGTTDLLPAERRRASSEN